MTRPYGAPDTPPGGATSTTGPRAFRSPPATPTPEETGRSSGPGSYAPEPPYRPPSIRATLGLLLVAVLLAGVAYPFAVTGFAQLVTPHTANGSLVDAPNGTAIASSLIGENISSPSLFWLRPSLTDWSATLSSGEAPYGPTDPALVNQTEQYIAQYGLTNSTAPLDLISPSASGIDADLTPEAVLVQIPRVALATNLSESFLMGFVDQHIQAPLLGFLGPSYVNVIQLDIDLLAAEGR